MPYFQRAWLPMLGKPAPRTVRLCALGNEEASEILLKTEPIPTYESLNLTADKLRIMSVNLTKEVQCYQTRRGADTIAHSNIFPKYNINKEETIFKGYFSNIFFCTNPSISPNAPIICRIFEKGALINPNNDPYIKTLRHVGKRHQACIATYDIFTDEGSRIFLFQELATFGNALDYVRQGQIV